LDILKFVDELPEDIKKNILHVEFNPFFCFYGYNTVFYYKIDDYKEIIEKVYDIYLNDNDKIKPFREYLDTLKDYYYNTFNTPVFYEFKNLSVISEYKTENHEYNDRPRNKGSKKGPRNNSSSTSNNGAKNDSSSKKHGFSSNKTSSNNGAKNDSSSTSNSFTKKHGFSSNKTSSNYSSSTSNNGAKNDSSSTSNSFTKKHGSSSNKTSSNYSSSTSNSFTKKHGFSSNGSENNGQSHNLYKSKYLKIKYLLDNKNLI
jgi:hypothetical protein